MALRQTASQTIGPFFAYGLIPKSYGYEYPGIASNVLATETTAGERIRLQGHVFDGEGAVVNDAMIEIWQADAKGCYGHPLDCEIPATDPTAFHGFGRAGTGAQSSRRYTFDTIKPGSTADGQAPHINMAVFMRGLLAHLYTRVYFSDHEAANATDKILNTVAPGRRDTLVARRIESPAGVTYEFNIRMQGQRETVFFDV
ncbi:MAG: protocatechuate 3,4-dioxygenase subunit alpha [Gammaproteobacteria bacterium]